MNIGQKITKNMKKVQGRINKLHQEHEKVREKYWPKNNKKYEESLGKDGQRKSRT